jgi:hypothetical protein
VGNERADFEASLGTLMYNAQSVARDLLPVTKQRMLDEWQKNWEVAETGRLSHSIIPRERKLITTVSRIFLENCEVKVHLKRFNIVDGSMCVSRGSRDCQPYNIEMLPFFVSKSVPE